MSTYVMDGSIYLASDSDFETSSGYNVLSIDGDTIRLVINKNPASTDLGYNGEICIGTLSGTTYLYTHNGSNWVRIPFSTY